MQIHLIAKKEVLGGHQETPFCLNDINQQFN